MGGDLGEIRMFAGNYAPKDWVLCQGQTLQIEDYLSLFQVIGTTYGGDGATNFALPDLRGRVPVGTGANPNLPGMHLEPGQHTGAQETYLSAAQIPNTTTGTGSSTGLEVLENTDYPQEPTPLNLMQPSMGINYIICLFGATPEWD